MIFATTEMLKFAQKGIQVEINKLNTQLSECNCKHVLKTRRRIQQLKQKQLAYERAEKGV